MERWKRFNPVKRLTQFNSNVSSNGYSLTLIYLVREVLQKLKRQLYIFTFNPEIICQNLKAHPFKCKMVDRVAKSCHPYMDISTQCLGTMSSTPSWQRERGGQTWEKTWNSFEPILMGTKLPHVSGKRGQHMNHR